MKHPILTVVAILLAAGTVAGQYHDPVYVAGGYYTTSSLYSTGFWLADTKNQTYTSLAPASYRSSTVLMDADNRRILYSVQGTTSASYPGPIKSGIFRYDPATTNLQTVMVDTLTLYRPYHLLINQDGDYVFGCQSFNPSDYHIFKIAQGGGLTTILSTTTMGNRYYFNYALARNMDTGNYLVNNGTSTTGLYYGILDVADDGTYTTYSTGGTYGWYGYYSMPQDHDTGFIEGQYLDTIYQLKPGTSNRTTLWHPGRPGGHFLRYVCKFDLQSAASKRWVAIGYFQTTKNNNIFYAPVVYYIDRKTYTVTYVSADPLKTLPTQYNHVYTFDFYRGRHLQTVSIAPRQWNIHLSCPNFPGKNYALLLSASGYRPGIQLPDNRTVHLNYDTLFNLSSKNMLKPFFDPGPLQLNAKGEAVGTLDLRALPPRLNMPVWMALAVLDPGAPNGIAYLPDTYVMRL